MYAPHRSSGWEPGGPVEISVGTPGTSAMVSDRLGSVLGFGRPGEQRDSREPPLGPSRVRAGCVHLVVVAFVNYGAGRREEAVEMLERIREASPDNIHPRILLAAHYEREGQHDRASAVVEEILRVRADFTAQDAIDLMPGVERAIGSEEFAQLTDALRKAGLP